MPDRPAAFDAIKALLDGPVAYHPALARVAGGVAGGVWLSQVCYWAKQMEKKAVREGAPTEEAQSVEYWKSLPEWREETGLSVKELRSARERLEALGAVTSRVDRADNKVYWRVDYERLAELLAEPEHLPKGQVVENPTSAERASGTCPRGKSYDGSSETTAETTNNGPGAAVKTASSQEPSRARVDVVAEPAAAGEALSTVEGPPPQTAADPGLPGPKSPSGEPSRGPERPDDAGTRGRGDAGTAPEDDDPKPPGGGRPLPALPADPSSPVPASPRLRVPASPAVSAILHGHQVLARAAIAAGLTPGEVARELLAGCPPKLVLAALRGIRRKRDRVTNPGGLFRALCARREEFSLADLVDADRELRGAGVEDLGFGRCLPDVSGKRPADYWRLAAAAKAQAKRAEDLRRVKRLLPSLRGADRRRAEQLLASA